jgi:hypothetical protein
MESQTPKTAPPDSLAGWTVVPSEKLPDPSIWPATLALAITFLVWGLVTSLIITGVGLALFAGALAGWILDIRHERARH